MQTANNPFFIVKQQSDNILSWKQNKPLLIVVIGIFSCIFSVFPFLVGIGFMISNFSSSSRPSIEIAFMVSISMNLLMIFLDITIVSVVFKQPAVNGYQRVQSLQELTSRPKRLVLLIVLFIIFAIITEEYWFPSLTLSHIIEIISSIALLLLNFCFQFMTIGIFTFGLYLTRNTYTITIDYPNKRIEKESIIIWKKTKQSIAFDELSALTVKPVVLPSFRWELVIMCKKKTFQIFIASKGTLTDYATYLQPLLNLPLEIV